MRDRLILSFPTIDNLLCGSVCECWLFCEALMLVCGWDGTVDLCITFINEYTKVDSDIFLAK